MRSIVYFSTSVAPMSKEALAALGRECADNDSHVGISGMLLHKDGNFLQVIEGSLSVVRDMYARIAADPRHTNVRIISDRTIPAREFAGQVVRFKDLDVVAADTPLLNPFSFEAFEADPDHAMLLLAFFYRNT